MYYMPDHLNIAISQGLYFISIVSVLKDHLWSEYSTLTVLGPVQLKQHLSEGNHQDEFLLPVVMMELIF